MSSPPSSFLLSPFHLPSTHLKSKKRKCSSVDWALIMDECKEGKTIQNVSDHHPEASYDAIWKRFKRIKSGDMTATINRHGEGHRIFSVEQEEILAARVRAMKTEGVPISYHVVQDEVINHFDDIHGTHQTRRNHRTFSIGYVQKMKFRQGFSIQKLSKKETQKTYSEDELLELACEYITAVSDAIKKFGASMVFNMDETPAPFLEIPKQTWGDKGKREKYVIKTIKRMKGIVTLMPTVAASGKKLKLAWINVGKTRQAINKMSLPRSIISFHSPKGWTNEDVMLKYLKEVIINYTKRKNCALILDDYGAHWTTAVQQIAKDNNIQLIRVPKGLTAVLQPLDISFNSQFNHLRGLECQNDMMRNAGGVEGKEKILHRASFAYHEVTKEIVLRGWKPIIIDQ